MEGRARSWWGWGYEDETLDEPSWQRIREGLRGLLGIDTFAEIRPPPASTIELRPPRISAPPQLAAFCSDEHLDRLSHAYGKAYVDVLRAVRGDFPNPPDLVAYPHDERQIAELIAFCEAERIALTPYGGGSSVVRGIEPTESNRYSGAITLDVRHFDRVLEVETVSRSAHVEAGVLGPALEAGLKPFGLTLRHFPQSFEFSTVGGWIATRAGGHAASGPTRIDDVVTGIRMVTPRGVLETRRVPSSGAGPSPERLALGSEGTLGVITDAWLRVQPIPRYRANTTVHFRDADDAIEAVRMISQADLWPSNCRLVSPLESAVTGLGDGRSLELILGFESHDRPVVDRLGRALEICGEFHGTWEASDAQGGEEPSAGRWRRWFLQAPYLRDRLVLLGLIVETLETAVSWDRLVPLQDGVLSAATGAIEADGGRGIVTWRLNYVYPDGVAPYYTVVAVGVPGREIDQWRRIKTAVTDAILECGGTTTHHHAVGKEHRSWYGRERGPVWATALEGVKRALDPSWILNPDVLIPADRAFRDAEA